ncbi:hypothetical protein GH714_036774 [Hevea brasiliensis]|uniref:Thioredoxin domain-containing protein n=1 Tax=Hevea brasiliensis TaxID=3981 RepID=A0A6A6NF25_HEVBR|nr:hypothetical protein GH714_036774 [Hevea brasiliensis]
MNGAKELFLACLRPMRVSGYLETELSSKDMTGKTLLALFHRVQIIPSRPRLKRNEDGVGTKLSDHVSDKNAMETDSSTPALYSEKEKLRSKKLKMKMDRKKKRRREEWEIADSIRWLAEVVVRSEQARMDTMRELEKMRIEAEAKRGEMDLKRTEIIANTQLEIAKLFAGVVLYPPPPPPPPGSYYPLSQAYTPPPPPPPQDQGYDQDPYVAPPAVTHRQKPPPSPEKPKSKCRAFCCGCLLYSISLNNVLQLQVRVRKFTEGSDNVVGNFGGSYLGETLYNVMDGFETYSTFEASGDGSHKSPLPELYPANSMPDWANMPNKKKTAQEIQELVRGERNVPLIIDFYATWCGPCILMAQELEMLAVEYENNAMIVKVDTDDEYEFACDMQNILAQVRGLPTLFFISPDPNKDAIRAEGLIPMQTMRDIIDKEMDFVHGNGYGTTHNHPSEHFHATNARYITRLLLHTRNSMADVVGAAAAAIDSMQGVLGAQPYVPRTKELEDFRLRWKKKFHQDHPDIVDAELNIYGLWAYDAAMALAMAIEEAGTTHFGFKRANVSSNSTDLETLKFSQNGPNLARALSNTSFKGLIGDFLLLLINYGHPFYY